MNEVLHSESLTLSRVGIGDIPDIYQAARESIEHLMPWMPWCHADYSIQETEAYVAKQIESWNASEEYSFTIRDKERRFAGMCGLNQFNRIHYVANLGYWLRKTCVGNGYATSATRLIAAFGLGELNLRRIEILVDVDNYPSQRVAERAGAVCEGILRSRLWLRDRSHDAVCYSMIADEPMD